MKLAGLVGNPEDRFSCEEAHMIVITFVYLLELKLYDDFSVMLGRFLG